MISIVLSEIPKNYLIFQHDIVIEDSVLSDKLSEKAKLTEVKSENSKAGHTVRLPWLKTKNVNINLIYMYKWSIFWPDRIWSGPCFHPWA